MKNLNQRNEPPDKLDGAHVIKWAYSGSIPFGVICYKNDSHKPIEIFGLAICQYENSRTFYRFCCNKNWEVIQDFDYGSISEAINQLPEQYRDVQADWQTK